MSSHQQTQFNLNNRIYLYNVLRTTLGVGKQTFITQVDEALASDNLSAELLGFETTRALMEALDEFVTLTVFKGGRVYVTVTAQPAWDEALDAAEEASLKSGTKGDKGGKPWKRKRGNKALKPVRPHTVAAEHAKQATDADAPTEDAEQATDAHDRTAEVADSVAATDEGAEAAAEAPATDEAAETAPAMPTANEPAEPADTEAKTVDAAAVSGQEPAPAQAPHTPEPTYSLTITFDPDHADAGETTLSSTPQSEPATHSDSVASTPAKASREASTATSQAASSTAPAQASSSVHSSHQQKPVQRKTSSAHDSSKDRASQSERHASAAHGHKQANRQPTGSSHHQPTAAPAPPEQAPASADPSDYPQDFTTDVYCPAPIMHELARLLPYGADALGIAGEYFYLACERGTAHLGRARASFPLRYLHNGKRQTATVTLKKRPHAQPAWAIETVEAPADAQ